MLCPRKERPLSSFYEDHCKEYFQATAYLDPSPFLSPLAKRLAPGATVLDVGCGSGRDLRWLADHGFKPTGFEQAPELAKMANNFCQAGACSQY
jgi:2-polyprenyl-3-methyl-5-hydroxy-6-metoxy-1,4-benzoquinol methylase